MSKNGTSRKKAAVIGAGYVGSSAAYAMMLKGIADEIVLIDIDRKKAEGEADDIRQGIGDISHTDIYAGDYSDCMDSGIIITSVDVPRVSPAGSVGASAFGRGVHRTPAPSIGGGCHTSVGGGLKSPTDARRS